MNSIIKSGLLIFYTVVISSCVSVGPLETSRGVEQLERKSLLLLNEIGLKARGYDVGVIDGKQSKKTNRALAQYYKDQHLPNNSYSQTQLFEKLYADTYYQSPIDSASVAAVRLCLHFGPANVRIFLNNLRELHCVIVGNIELSPQLLRTTGERACHNPYPQVLRRHIHCEMLFDGRRFVPSALRRNLFAPFDFSIPVRLEVYDAVSGQSSTDDAFILHANTYDILFDKRRYYAAKNIAQVVLADGTVLCKGRLAAERSALGRVLDFSSIDYEAQCGGGQYMAGTARLVGFHDTGEWLIPAQTGEFEDRGSRISITPRGRLLQ